MGRSDVRIFRRYAASLDELEAVLFAAERMEKRFYFFEKLCLPSLQHQLDSDFRVTILASERMPERYKVRLAEAISNTTNIEILYAPVSSAKHAFTSTVERNVSVDDENSIHFRLDDDDAFPNGFIEKLKSSSLGLEPDSLISLPKGYALFSQDGVPYLAPHFLPYHARGWARVNAPGDRRTPYNFAHFGASLRFKSVLDPRPLGYIATYHDSSDSNWHRRKGREAEMIEKAKEQMQLADFDAYKTEVDNAFPWIGYDGLKKVIVGAPSTE